MIEFQTSESLTEHYVAVRMRLMAAPKLQVLVPRPSLPEPEPLLALPAPRSPSAFIAHLRRSAELSSFDMVRLLSFHREVLFDDVVGISRKRAISQIRQEMIFVVWAVKGLSLPAVGRVFGHRDHTTVLHAVRKVCRQYGIECEPENRAAAAEIGLAILCEAGWKPPIKTEGAAQ